MKAMQLAALTMLGAGALCLLTGCTTTRSSHAYVTAEPQSARPVITESLFKADQARMDNEAIAQILDGRISLPAEAHLAVLPFGESGYGGRWMYSVYESVDEAGLDAALAKLGESARVRRVSLLPALMLPEATSISHLREAAARFQADLLLVYRVSTRSYRSYRVLRKDEGSTYAYVEAMLLDVRTGVVPFASTSAETIAVEGSREDVTFGETQARAAREAAGRALLGIAEDLSAFLAKAS